MGGGGRFFGIFFAIYIVHAKIESSSIFLLALKGE